MTAFRTQAQVCWVKANYVCLWLAGYKDAFITPESEIPFGVVTGQILHVKYDWDSDKLFDWEEK